MRIVSLELKGYKRLALSLCDTITIDFVKPIQVILGTNGSGKSSIKNEATPLPGYHRDFYVGGYKKVIIEDKGMHYELLSEFPRGTGLHSCRCIDTGDYYQEKGTYKVQLELVENMFGWTKEIHDVLLGNKRFTEMSVTERRNWLTKLCPIDMSPAFDLFKKTSSYVRDKKGFIKQVGERLVKEAENALSDDELKRIEEDIKYYHKKLMDSLTVVSDVTAPTFDVQDRLATWIEECKTLLSREPIPNIAVRVNDKDEWLEARNNLKEEITYLQSRIDTIVQQVSEYESTLKDITQAASGDIDTLTTKRTQLLKEKEALEQTLQGITITTKYPTLDVSHWSHDEHHFVDVIKNVAMVITAIPNNRDGYFSGSKFNAATERMAELTSLKSRLEHGIDKRHNRLDDIHRCHDITCPTCNTVFKPGVEKDEKAAIEQSIEKAADKLEEVVKELEKLSQYLTECEEYKQSISAYRGVVNTYPQLAVLWEYYLDNKLITTEPQGEVAHLQTWADITAARIALHRKSSEFNVVDNELRSLQGVDKQYINKLKDHITTRTAEVGTLTQALREYKKRLSKIEHDIELATRYRKEVSSKIEEYEEIVQGFHDTVAYDFQQSLAVERSRFISKSNQLEGEKNKHLVRLGTRDVLNEEKEQAIREQKLMDYVVKALNPTGGLIGRYLKASMGDIVERMCKIIEQVWTYSLVVEASPLDKDDLTYKFPIKTPQISVEDISLGSSAQKDIINLSFILVAMNCLDIDECPLYLDEFGSSFDVIHRQRLMTFLTQCLDNKFIHQCFFISHYVSMFGAVREHGDVIVLDDSNIEVPEVYNTHVAFKG